MKKMMILSILTVIFALSAQAKDDGTDIGSGSDKSISSEEVTMSASRISERLILADNTQNGTRVQIFAERLGTATDVSNTHRLILSISRIGEIYGTEASFVLGKSMNLSSAKRLSGGIYQLTYNDADNMQDGLAVSRTVDARQAVSDVQAAPCDEGNICHVYTSVKMK